MQDVTLPTAETSNVPKLACNSHIEPFFSDISTTIRGEYEWLEHAYLLTNKEELCQEDWISWSAYNASISKPPINLNTPSLMLSLFREHASEPTTMFHSLKLE